jgi:hypothetical protein
MNFGILCFESVKILALDLKHKYSQDFILELNEISVIEHNNIQIQFHSSFGQAV